MYESRVDPYRTGANLNETILNTANVNASDFGLLFTMPVDSQIINQALYAPGLTINNTIHNVVYIATFNGSVYAYDADKSGPPLWVTILKGQVSSTPIIDPDSSTIYVAARSLTKPYVFKVHALDLITGSEKFGGPVTLTGTYPAQGNSLIFSNESAIKQHTGLALANGRLIVCFTGDGEGIGVSYHGWIISLNASNLQQTGAFADVTLPPAVGGGIWQSGRAPAVDDDGNVYLFTGNAYEPSTFKATNGYDGINNFGESLLKFDSNLNLIDSFTPEGWANLDNSDSDLSGSGPTLLPGTNLITGGGKDGNLYIWQTSNLGHLHANDSQVVQKIAPLHVNGVGYPGPIFSGPVFWNRSAEQGNSLLFNVYRNSPIFSFAFNGSNLNTTPVTYSSVAEASGTGNKNAISLSANGGESGTGIVWEFQNNPTTKISVLRAFNAENLSNELWNSSIYLSDSLGGKTTFVPPTVVNGKVYAPTYANQLMVYGIDTPPILATPANQNSALGTSVNFALNTTNTSGHVLFYSAKGLPTGLAINSDTGIVTGKPIVIGNYKVTITVTDNIVDPVSKSFTWTISRGLIKPQV